ncbi:helix-turn-helix transcriptional regulator [Plantactinospora sp. B5E13]|uniref:helix-turn-helix transcriptional regulator n=1 Tax=Plantactinospora sp. B5E13 TaxID=3153758 RepID=UPI00325CC793
MALKRQRLADRRRAVGHTQESLAEKLGVDRTTVVRWERAESDPQPWARPRLADALQVPLEKITELLEDIGEVNTRRTERLGHALRSPRAVDLATAAQLRDELDVLTLRYDSTPSTALLPNAVRLHADIALFRAHASAVEVRRALARVHATSLILLGQLVWDASQRRDRTTTVAYYEQATSAARQGDDLLQEAHARLRSGYVALYADRDLRRGLAQAAQATELAHRFGSHALAGLATLHVGEAHAMLGDRSACDRALGDAGRELGVTPETDPCRPLVAAAQFARVAGSCYLSLGDARKAETLLEAAMTQLSDRTKSRAITSGNLALARLRQREIDGAVVALHAGVDVVERTRAGGGMNVLFKVGRELRPWRGRVDVQEVTDRLFQLMAG